MFRLTNLSIRSLLLLMIFLVALPATAIILYSGIAFRNETLSDARKETVKLNDRIVSEQQSLVVGAEQLMTALAQLPEVKNRETAKVEPILRELRKLNSMYSNIFIADREGVVWATAVPVKPPFVVADRRYFKNALSSRKLSSGEYVVSWAVTRPVFNLAYPLKNDQGAVIGVISVGFLIDQYRLLLDRMKFPAHTSFVLIDHQGLVLSRAINPEPYIGKPYPPQDYQQMKEGPESGITVRTGIAGDKRIISYRKLRLEGEQAPYMYITAGIPVESAVSEANQALLKNMLLLSSFLLLACIGAVLFGKHSIVDRFKLLEDASRRLAAGDLQVRVSNLVAGGELGRLGKSFDAMAEELSRRESERMKREEERQKFERQLQHTQKLESLGVLAGGIAHDFNNILTAIIGNADIALMRINKESAAIENLHRIEQAAARASDLTRQMLAYSGKGRFVIESIDLNILLEEMLHMLEVSISKKAVLRLNLAKQLPPVEADATQLRQIIMNLVINASEAIGDMSGVISVNSGSMECDRAYLRSIWLDENIDAGLYVFLEIADTGCGMTKETMAKLFDPFFTTKFTGRGLGMAAVLGIVRGHKGTINVYSEEGIGTTFKILLPASDRPVEAVTAESPGGNWKGKGKVLLVDDEETVRSIAGEMLNELGFTTILATDGREAVELFKATPDVAFVILDLTMPHMDGEQCFRELRQLNPGIKIIISSGYNQQEVTQKFVGKGLAGFIQKPYRMFALVESIRKL